MSQEVLVTLMRRWGSIDGHTYIAGVCTTQDEAVRVGIMEWEDRGCGKYEYEVLQIPLTVTADPDFTKRPEGKIVASTCDSVEQRLQRFKNKQTLGRLRLAAKGIELPGDLDAEVICPHCGKGVE